MRPTPTPSRKRLREELDLTSQQAREVKEILKEAATTTQGRRIEKALLDISDIIDGFGVESIRVGSEDYSGYWGDAAAAYINTGDIYNATVIYDVDRDRFYLTSVGDWREAAERGRRFTMNPKIVGYRTDTFTPNQEMKSMDFGDLPTKKAFMKAFYRDLGEDGEYTMLLRGEDADAAIGTEFERAIDTEAVFDEHETWDGIKDLKRHWEEGSDEAGSLASAILGTLGFEWI